jgi:hypothetical protein
MHIVKMARPLLFFLRDQIVVRGIPRLHYLSVFENKSIVVPCVIPARAPDTGKKSWPMSAIDPALTTILSYPAFLSTSSRPLLPVPVLNCALK